MTLYAKNTLTEFSYYRWWPDFSALLTFLICVMRWLRRMRVLLCERDMAGHRGKYLEYLCGIPDAEIYCYAPANLGLSENNFIPYSPKNNLVDYFFWVREIKKIVLEKKIDVVHILDGDSIMKYMGIGFETLKCVNVIFTFHHFFSTMSSRLVYHMMLCFHKRFGVVHGQSLKNKFIKIGINNIFVVNYPAFDMDVFERMDSNCEKKKWELNNFCPVIGIIGGMASYKGIENFLKIISDIHVQYQLLVCGNADQNVASIIKKLVKKLGVQNSVHFKELTNEEYHSAIVASDVIYCIYTKDFDGASGIMTDGVCARKAILACDHGLLGRQVSENHLGYVADCENPKDILNKTLESLSNNFSYDDTAEMYRGTLKTQFFKENYMNVYRSSGL